MNLEKIFIDRISKSRYIGDDGAVIGEWVYSSDAFFENVHFKREWLTLYQIGYKAMIVNISDAIVMNAIPKYALLTVAFPKTLSKKDILNLQKGIKDASNEYNIEIIGGDTIENIKIDISITIIAQTTKPIYRNNISKNDIIAYTGELGSVKRDLELLLNNKKISKKSKFIKPTLRGDFFYDASQYITSALDISDGLFFELERLSKANKIGFKFFLKIPSNIGCSGEEYEILFSFNERDIENIMNIAKRYNLLITPIAKAIRGSYKKECREHHFE